MKDRESEDKLKKLMIQYNQHSEETFEQDEKRIQQEEPGKEDSELREEFDKYSLYYLLLDETVPVDKLHDESNQSNLIRVTFKSYHKSYGAGDALFPHVDYENGKLLFGSHAPAKDSFSGGGRQYAGLQSILEFPTYECSRKHLEDIFGEENVHPSKERPQEWFSISKPTLEKLVKAKEEGCKRKNKRLQEVVRTEKFDWDEESYQNQSSSGQFQILLITILVFFFGYSASNLITVISKERESGVIQLMKINGLTWFTYWASQLLSFLIQVLLHGLPLIVGILICMIQTGEKFGTCLLVFFMYLIFILGLAPFTFAIACVVKSQDGNTLVAFFYWICLPLPAFFISKVYDQFEPLGVRFFLNLIPQCNFFFMMRDIIRAKLHADVMLFAFLNFFLWSAILYYVDHVFSTKKSAATRSPLFCFERLWKGDERISLVGDLELPSNCRSLLSVKNLTKKWSNGIVAVDNLDLDLDRNQIFGLLGFNGAGKTTLINVITGQTTATSGDVYVRGKSVTNDLDMVRALVNVCPQENLVFEKLSVRQHMLLFGALYGSSEEEILRKTQKMLDILQMPDEIDTLPEHLSGGSKRKLNLMIAFSGKAEVLLLDEPTSGVDSDARRVMWDLINDQKKDKLILFTTHQMNEADILCDQIAIMSHGRILVQDSSVGLKKNYGVGYKIVLELPRKQRKFVKEFAAKIDEQSTVDMTGDVVVCKVSDEKFLVPMLKMLEEKFPKCKISTKCSSLNEVFLKLAHENEIDKKSVQEQENLSKKLQQMTSTIYERPAACYQLLYMFAKRFWYSIIYYSPLILLLLACVLGFIVQFGVSRMLVIQGNNGTYSLSNSFSTEMLYTQNDELFNGKYHVKPDTWKEGCEGRNLESNWFPVVCITQKESDKYVIKMNPSYESYLNLILTNIVANEPVDMEYDTERFQSGTSFNPATAYISNLTTVIILSLVVVLVLTYAAREMKSRIYEYQLNTGVRPWVYWLSHYIYDCSLIVAVMTFFQWIIRDYTAVPLSKGFVILLLNIPALVYVMYLFLIYTKDRSRTTQLGKYFMIAGIVWITVFEGIIMGFHAMGLKEEDRGDFYKEYFLFATKNPYHTTQPMFRFFLVMRALNPYAQILSTFNTALFGDTNTGLEDEAILVWACMIGFYFLLFHVCLYVNFSCCSSDKVDDEKSNQHQSVMQIKQEVDSLTTFVKDVPRCAPYVCQMCPNPSNVETDVESNTPVPAVLSHRISKVFKKASRPFTAVNNLSFKIESGQCFGLLGKNGAGKSTAINMLTGMLPPSSGNGYIFETSLKNDSLQIRQDVGLCPQENILWNKFSVYNHLYYYAAMNGVPISEIDARITTLIDLLGLNLFKDIACGHLSGGNKRKVMLATSLTGGSRVLFFDEPTAGVDPVARKKGLDVVQKYKADRPVVLTTHIMEECEEICDQVGIMVNGDFVIHGTLLDLVQNANAFYQIDLNVKTVEEKRSKQIATEARTMLKNAFAAAECIAENKFVLTYRVYNKDLGKLSELFEIMNKFAEKWSVEYFISEIDTEQLFLLYTADQRPDDTENRVCM